MVFEQGSDIYYARFDKNGLKAGAPYAVTVADNRQLSPEVAYSPLLDQYLVIWTDRRSGVGETVRGRWVELEPYLGDGDPFSDETMPGEEDPYQAPAKSDQWQAVGLRPGLASDYDVLLYGSPFYTATVELASSMRGQGMVDVVIMNGHQSDQTAFYPLARHYLGYNYTIQYAPQARNWMMRSCSSQSNNDKRQALSQSMICVS